MADQIEVISDRSELTKSFECYIARVLEQVAICRRIGVAPLAFWDLQVLERFETSNLLEYICK